MNPVNSETELKKKIISYLDFTMPVKKAMGEKLSKTFEDFQNGTGEGSMDFVQPPYIEVTQSYKSSEKSLQDLANDGTICEEVARAFAQYFGSNDPASIYPYTHQENSLREVKGGKNLVVCTGTGSGKTECFLLPVIDAIYRQHKEAKESGRVYDKHIRAMILYPMNALVNDQINRLRRILNNLPEITFGRYTGETEKKPEQSRPIEVNSQWENLPKEKSDNQNDLPNNEYLTRNRWRNDGVADILVTNYAMLERLMLLPDNNFFDACWNFIILDEAHSYTGSTGTEIAWLMRRLERRLKKTEDDHIQFLATSATLSSTNDEAKQKQEARDFASKIFPALPDSFYVEFGTTIKYDDISKNANDTTLQGSISDFIKNNAALYNDTISYEREKRDFDAKKHQMSIIEKIRDNKIPAQNLIELNRCDFSNRKNQSNDIVVDDAIKFMVNLVLSRGEGYDDWREFLHDESLPGGSPIENDNNANGQRNRVGNRLNILQKWRDIQSNNNDIQSIDFVTFHYLYFAAIREIQNNDNLNFDIPSLLIKLTDGSMQALSGEKEDFENKKPTIESTLCDLNTRWREALSVQDKNLDYPAVIFNSIVKHQDVKKYFETIENNEHLDFHELVREIGCSDDDKLRNLFNLGALAVQKGTRRPLIDVRYHQLVRHIGDIGIYFEDGDIKKPHFVRNQEEYAPKGEKIFTLGVCHYCGHPYLLGYAQGGITQNGVDYCIFRAETSTYGILHAFSWLDPAQDDDNEQEDNGNQSVWLNLKSGVVSLDEKNEDGWIKLKAMLMPNNQRNDGQQDGGSANSKITKCFACGRQQNNTVGGKFGLIAPYEAKGEIYKIAVLDAFATLSDGDNQRDEAVANGRKILVFSDSRQKAASLVFRFEKWKDSRLIDKLILKLAGEYEHKPELTDQARGELIRYENAFQIDAFRKQAEAEMQRIRDDQNSYEKNPNPTIEKILVGTSPNGRLYEKLERYRYIQLLDFEDDNGVLVQDLLAVSKFKILRALRNGPRYNLIRKNLILISSKKIENYDWKDLAGKLGTSNDVVIKDIARKIYIYLIRRIKVCFENNRVFENSLDDYKTKPITRTNFVTCDRTHKVYQIVSQILGGQGIQIDNIQLRNWLNELLQVFTDGLGILRQYGNNQREPEYALNFGNICNDLQISLNPNNNDDTDDVMPFVIQEHTAQIDGKMGAIYQKLFSEGRINILSCSTTFEMGIDVGGLNNVFLTNLPPASSNYRQRAGRAGRRPGAAAYILSLAGDSSYEQDFYSNARELFWGEITPPQIYLNQAIFAARHFRAEALHSFFVYLHKKGSENRNDVAREWKKISRFILGYRWIWDNNNPENGNMQPCDTCCKNHLEGWANQERENIKSYLKGINGYEGSNLGNDYSAVDDILFQLGYQVIDSTKDYTYYRNLGGCRIPELNGDKVSDSSSPKRQGLKDRLIARLKDYANNDNGNLPTNPSTMPQKKLLLEQTIDILSETCILPRYGFPTDIIELLPDREDVFSRGVKMQRPLELGLFEFAPGQSIICNKRNYISNRPAVSVRPGNDNERYDNSLAGRMSQNTRYCRNCKKVFSNQNNKCPTCDGDLQGVRYITPEVFFANRGIIRDVSALKGTPVIHWGGDLINENEIDGLRFSTGESSDRMLQYINPGPGGSGFRYNNNSYFYVHEVQTNIAIWRLQNIVFEGWDRDRDSARTYNALQSAMFAIRRSIAKVLKVCTRDIGSLIKYNAEANSCDFVFFDRAAGGGGCALSLVKQDNNDQKTENCIKDIVNGAIKALKGCTCTGIDHNLSEDEKNLTPVSIPEYRTRQNQDLRPVVACNKCLKDFDNQALHDRLDRWDALRVLESLVKPSPDDDFDPENDSDWEPLQEGEMPLNGCRYKLADGTAIYYDNTKHDATQIVAKERE